METKKGMFWNGKYNYDKPVLYLIFLLIGVFLVALSIHGNAVDDTIANKDLEPETETEAVVLEPDNSEQRKKDLVFKYATQAEIKAIAQTIYGEARGCSKMEKAAVAWCILNRVDSDLSYMPDTIMGVITQKNQFVGYSKRHPATEELLEIATDVVYRWAMEKESNISSGRVIPKDYLWFNGNGKRNIFRNRYKGGSKWNWSYYNPYK